MKRIPMLVISFLLLIPVITLSWLNLTESGLRWLYQQSQSYLPGELKLTNLKGRLIGPINAASVEYIQAEGVRVKAEQLSLDWQPVMLMSAQININRFHVKSIKVDLPETEKSKNKSNQPVSLPELHLPWRVALNDVAINDINIIQNQQAFKLKQLKLNVTSRFSHLAIEQLSVNTERFNLNIKGELWTKKNYPHKLELLWQAKLPSSAIVKGAGQLSGDIKKIHVIQQLNGALQLGLDAEINNLLEQLNWQAKLDVIAFNASQLVSEWPELSGKLKIDGKGDLNTATLSGNLDAAYPELGTFDADFKLQRLSDNSIQIERLMLHTQVSETRLHVSGLWKPGDDGGNTALALHWQNLRWPLENQAWFDSSVGSGWIEGNLNHYQIGLATDRPWSQAPPSDWYASAEGNLEGVNFQSLRVTSLDGEVTASGPLGWSPQLIWQAKLEAVNINPASLLPEWPGQLNAKLNSNGRFENGQLTAESKISELSGKLRGYPVKLHSRLAWYNNGLDISYFDFHSGTSSLSARGQVGETLNMNWSINASNLGELYPQTKGQLQASGVLGGTQKFPIIKASFEGQTIRLPNYEIGNIDGTLSMDMFRWQQVNIKLSAKSLNINGNTLQTLEIDGDTQQLKVKAVSEVASAEVELKGELDSKGWHGYLNKANIQSKQFNHWQLKEPGVLNISEKTLQVDSLCWINNQQADLCVSLKRDQSLWQSSLEMNKFQLKSFSPWLPPDVKAEGVANATAELHFESPKQLLGQVQIEFPASAVNYPLLEGERERWEYRGGTLAINLDEKGVTANAKIAMNNGDLFQAKAELPGAQLLTLDKQQQNLHAEAQLTVHDLGLIEALIPEVQDLNGDVALNLSVAGVLAKPELTGNAKLIKGSLRIPRLGLTIDQLSMKSQSEGFEKLNFQLDARSGEGNLTVEGKTALNKALGWPTEINIKGNEFEVSRIPEARLLISPDLIIKIQKRTIDIKGEVHIPYAKLQPKDITTAARVSNDAVIVGGAEAKQEKWSITTGIRLTLGERVNFYGFGFEGRLGGSLLLEDEPGQLTKATGEIIIPEGRYRAYGQRLNVENGRLLYTGGPISNPGLDLRAVRHSTNVIAGLKVRGSLNKPHLELFSIPAMDQTDALSYLLLGRSIENASGEDGAMMAKATLALGLSGGNRLVRALGDRFGLDEVRVEGSETGDQASLVMGRYLAPKLYVSYGVGLIEAFNTFTVRYQISDKWQLKAESGEHQGADLFYTIDR